MSFFRSLLSSTPAKKESKSEFDFDLIDVSKTPTTPQELEGFLKKINALINRTYTPDLTLEIVQDAISELETKDESLTNWISTKAIKAKNIKEFLDKLPTMAGYAQFVFDFPKCEISAEIYKDMCKTITRAIQATARDADLKDARPVCAAIKTALEDGSLAGKDKYLREIAAVASLIESKKSIQKGYTPPTDHIEAKKPGGRP